MTSQILFSYLQKVARLANHGICFRNLVLYPTELPGPNDERDSSRIALASTQRDDSPFK